MVYEPHRRHAVASFATTIQALGLMQHLYTPNILILIGRILAQIQINGSAFIHPNRSLFGLSIMVSMMNLAAAFLHLLDFVGGMNGGKGLVLDFVGQGRPASLTRIILLDLTLYILQSTSLCISYISSNAHNLPKSPAFPYDDLLLPPNTEYTVIPAGQSLFDEGEDAESALDLDLDLESGQKRRRGRRKGYEQQEEVVWLDEEDERGGDEHARLLSPIPRGRSSTRISEPPLIFSLPFHHILHLIFSLPAPNPPPRAFSGGTPSTSPPLTPLVVAAPVRPLPAIRVDQQLPPQSHSEDRVQDDDDDDAEEEEEGDEGYGGILGRRARRTATAARTEQSGQGGGRIPGEWSRGDGG